MFDDPLSFLNRDHVLIYSAPMARRFGIYASILVSQLVYARSKKPVEHEGELWVTLSTEEIYEDCYIKSQDQEKAFKALSSNKIIKMKVFGDPPSRHFWLDEEKIIEISGRFA